jgi:hypothetical protein
MNTNNTVRQSYNQIEPRRNNGTTICDTENTQTQRFTESY